MYVFVIKTHTHIYLYIQAELDCYSISFKNNIKYSTFLLFILSSVEFFFSSQFHIFKTNFQFFCQNYALRYRSLYILNVIFFRFASSSLSFCLFFCDNEFTLFHIYFVKFLHNVVKTEE